ncbi:cytochrome b-c1 complex subunit 2, mitochondrial [Galendromus occidentalis]|uniref:Cytochrome b-c1 complex subunit 2, mitochondrial n=1 Tax=Galendromus occidentalis TaxID=34638 RepID=A0AAJ6QSQ9_9ACAR|nr:cytochrome b-c1 complex subunit 2, mitochondrial [Galendromus occidentalis]
MASLLPKFAPLKRIPSRAYSAQVAVSQKRLPSEETRLTTLDNGLSLYSVENQSPVSRVVIVTKAGSRYETGPELGASHLVRCMAGLRTKNSTSFGITRNVEWVGGNISAAATRDHLIYTLECNRDYVASTINFLNDVVFAPTFKHWQIDDIMPKLNRELAVFQQNQGALLMEALHQASFRGGLANSLFVHPSMIGKLKSDILTNFHKDNVTGPRTVVSAVGVDHERLVHIYKKCEHIGRSSTDDGKPSRFNPHGGEVRVDFAAPNTMVALAMESSGLAKPQDALTMEVLKHVLGMSKARVPFSELGATRLGKAVLATKPANPFSIGAFTANYSDTGLFGIALAANNNDIAVVSKAAIGAVRDLGKGNISASELEAAKNKAKYAIAKRVSKNTKTARNTAIQHLTQGGPQSYEKSISMIDAITSADIANVTQKMSRVKPSMAAVGKTYNVPHLDELLQ